MGNCSECGQTANAGSVCSYCGHDSRSESATNQSGEIDWAQKGFEAESLEKAGNAVPTRGGNPIWAGLRWLLVIPAGLVAALAATFPIHWAVLLVNALSNDDDGSFGLTDLPPDTLERGAYAFFSPLVVIFVGSRVAPAFRIQTSWVLAAFWGVVLVASQIYIGTSERLEFGGPLEAGVAAILGVGGIVAGIAAVRGDIESS